MRCHRTKTRRQDSTDTIARREVLRGLGASLTLQWLESMARAGETDSASEPPVRFGTLVFASVVNPYQWWAKGNGKAMELSPTLQPLAPYQHHITVLREFHVFNNTSGPH
ncbi:MAG: DUF1552 domain-containing protein [Planctomycetota bacterium]